MAAPTKHFVVRGPRKAWASLPYPECRALNTITDASDRWSRSKSLRGDVSAAWSVVRQHYHGCKGDPKLLRLFTHLKVGARPSNRRRANRATCSFLEDSSPTHRART